MVLRTVTSTRRWPRIALTAAGIAGLVTATAGWVASATDSHPIHACAAKHGGALRIAKHCTSTETAISWNKVGPRGPAGVIHAYVGRYSVVGHTGTQLASAFKVLAHTPKAKPGLYLVNASVAVAQYSDSGTTCRLATALGNTSVGVQRQEAQTPPGSAGANADLSLTGMFSKVVANDSFEVQCRDYHVGAHPSSINNAEINAIPVNAVSALTDATP
jgi:hypothetical protein